MDVVGGTKEDPAVVAKTCEQEPGVTRIELTVLATSTPNRKFVPGSRTDVVWGTEKDPAVVAKSREQEPGATRIESTVLATSRIRRR